MVLGNALVIAAPLAEKEQSVPQLCERCMSASASPSLVTLWSLIPHRSRIRRELFIEEIQAAAGEGGARVARVAEGESSCDGTESDSGGGGGGGSGSVGADDRGRSLSNSPKPNHHHHHHSQAHLAEDGRATAPGTSDGSKPSAMESLFGGAIAATVAASTTATADKNPKDSSVRRRKAANLNNIIHRLEKAANRDELGNEWEF